MGSPKVPDAPAQPSTAEGINAYIAGMPKMYANQLEYAPQMAAQEVSMMEQYLPQITALQQQLQSQYAPEQAAQQWALQQQYAPLLAAQQQQLQQQYEPEAYAAKENIGAMLTPEYLSGQGAFNVATDPSMQAMTNMVTPEWMTGYSAQEAPGMQAARERLKQQTRGAWADRGLAQSGMSAENEAKMLSEFELPYAMQQEQLTQQVNAQRQALGTQLATTGLQSQQNAWQNYYNELGRRQNMGLSMAGRYNVPGQTSVSTPQIGISGYQAPNLMEGYNFGNVMGGMNQGYGTAMSGYNAQLGNQGGGWGSALGSIGGGAAGGIGAGMGASMMGLFGGGAAATTGGSVLGGGLIASKVAMLLGCFPEGSKVNTKDGDKNIEDIKLGDEIVGGNVLKISKELAGDDFMFCDFVTKDGELIASRDHPIYSKILDIKSSKVKSEYAYDILTDSGTYFVNGIKVGTTIKEL